MHWESRGGGLKTYRGEGQSLQNFYWFPHKLKFTNGIEDLNAFTNLFFLNKSDDFKDQGFATVAKTLLILFNLSNLIVNKCGYYY